MSSEMMIRLARNNAGEPIVTSLVIAELFDKEHKNVLRAIDNLEIPTGSAGVGPAQF